jgi:hypothetical protein
MILYQKDGITVQAQSPQEEAEYKRLGFTKVEEPTDEQPAEDAAEKAGE